MDDSFRFADELGPIKIVHIHEARTGLRAIVAIDNVACGPAIGGVRMARDVSATEAFRLARAMTQKNAAAGLAHGGGKSVIFGDPRMPLVDKERTVRAFARAVGDLREYIPGPDMGTDERCMGWIKDEIDRAVGLPRELGGIPLDEIGATGFGLAVAVDAARGFVDLDLQAARVAVQGFGAVGRHAARFLHQKGAVLVAASDTHGAIFDPDGLDVESLAALKQRGRPLLDHSAGRKLDRDAIIDVACEIWIPAARPDVLTSANVARLNTRIVAEGANIPATEDAEKALHQRGILVIPDVIANAGGAICAAIEFRGGGEAQAFATIEEKILANTRHVLAAARSSDITPRAAAIELAETRVRRAMEFRRFG